MRSSLLKKMLLDRRASLPFQISVPMGKASCGTVELCQVPTTPEHPFFHASPCCSQTIGCLGPSNKYINVAVGYGVQIRLKMGRQKVDFGPRDKTLCADPSLILPRGLACPWCWQGTNWQFTLRHFILGLHPSGERTQSCHTAWNRCQCVALVCGNGPCKGVLLSAAALHPPASTFDSPSPSRGMLRAT